MPKSKQSCLTETLLAFGITIGAWSDLGNNVVFTEGKVLEQHVYIYMLYNRVAISTSLMRSLMELYWDNGWFITCYHLR